jgi:autotransporter-associated beta strand protein
VERPVYGSGDLRPLTTSIAALAFSEGWADYFCVAANSVEGAGGDFNNLGSIGQQLKSDGQAKAFKGWVLTQPAQSGKIGRGEDDEASVARILWALATDPRYGVAASASAPAHEVLFDMLRYGQFPVQPGQPPGPGGGEPITTLAALWSDLSLSWMPLTTVNTYARLFQDDHVSPKTGRSGVNPSQPGQIVFGFDVPVLRNDQDPSPLPEDSLLTFTGVTLQFYLGPNDVLDPSAEVSFQLQDVNGAAMTVTHQVNTPPGSYEHWTCRLAISSAAWQNVVAALSTHPGWIGGNQTICWSVGGVCAGTDVVTGPYWSRFATFQLTPLAIPQQFRAGIITNGVTSNGPQLVYDIVGTTIPGFTVTVYASPTGLFDDGTEAPAGYYYVGDPGSAPPLPNLCVIDADEADYLTATSSDYERTVTLPASALDPNVLAADPDGYLLAKIHFDGDTTDADDIWVRFEGGAFQTTGGAVWAYASASLDDVTPDSNNPDTIEVAATQSGVTVSDVGGAEWDPVSYNEAFTSVWGNTTVFAHEGNNAITATSAGCPSGVDIQAGDGGNTIDGTGMDWLGGLYVQAGNGDNTVLGGAGTVDASAGDGDNVVRCTSGNYSGSWVALGDGDNTVYGGPYDDTIILGNGDSTVYLGVADTLELGCGNDAVQFGTGDNTFIVDAAVAGTTGIHPATGIVPGENTLELAYTATSPPPDLSGLTLPSGSMQLPTGSDLSYSGIAQLGLDFEGGGTVGMPAVPPGTNVTVGSGTTLDMAGNTTPLGAVTLEDGTLNLGGTTQTVASLTLAGGTVVDGTISAGAYDLHSGTVSASLGGDGAVTVDGYGTVLLNAEQNTYGGGTAVESGILEALTPAAPLRPPRPETQGLLAATHQLSGLTATRANGIIPPYGAIRNVRPRRGTRIPPESARTFTA